MGTLSSIFRNTSFHLGYVPSLDGVRAIAILSVMLAHANVPYCQAGGGVGVDIFFVLSGFLITSILAQEWRDFGTINLKRFYTRRILRLFPALVFLLLVYLGYSFYKGPISNSKSFLIDTSIVLFYAANWVRAFNLKGLGLLDHTWSLSIEEQFYLVWPLSLIFLLKFVKSRFVVIGVTLLATIGSYLLRTAMHANGASIYRLYNGLDTRADSLLMGCAMAILLYSGLLPLHNVRFMRFIRESSLLALIGLFALVVLFPSYASKYRFLWSHVYFLMSVCSAFLVFGLIFAPVPLMKKCFVNSFFIRTGKISYGLYLWHYPIFLTMQSYKLSWPVVVIFGALLTYAIAELSYRVIEQPFLRLKNLLDHSKTTQQSDTE